MRKLPTLSTLTLSLSSASEKKQKKNTAHKKAYAQLFCIPVAGICLEAIGEAKVEWMTSSDIQASDEEVFNHTTVLPIKGMDTHSYRRGKERRKEGGGV